MSKVITFSRVFPAYHPRKGEDTYFVEQIWNGLGIKFPSSDLVIELENINTTELGVVKLYKFINSIETTKENGLKYHTIRAGNRWKVGNKFSPRIWSGKPYNSKQIIIAPDIEIKRIWSFECDKGGLFYINKDWIDVTSSDITKNDGLNADDFLNWFPINKPFKGQIICWNENINY